MTAKTPDQIDMMGEDELRAALRGELARIEKLRASLNNALAGAKEMAEPDEFGAVNTEWVYRSKALGNFMQIINRIYVGG